MKLSVQCYTVRDQMAQDPKGTLKALRDMGLNYVECSGTYGLSATGLRSTLDELGLKCSGTHAGFDALAYRPEEVADENKALGSSFTALAWIGKEKYENGWAGFAKELTPIAEKVKAAGLVFGYHNHDFEFQDDGGRPGYDVLFESVPADLMVAQLDCYWVAYAGYDPASYIKKLKGRIPQVHFKDGKVGLGEPKYLPVGQGDLDYDGIIAACREVGVEFASIELDTSPGDPLDAVRESVDYLRSKGISD